jgi:hypothetical protein
MSLGREADGLLRPILQGCVVAAREGLPWGLSGGRADGLEQWRDCDLLLQDFRLSTTCFNAFS